MASIDKGSVCCEIIKTCPLSCLHCSSNSNMQSNQLIPIEDLLSIVEDAAKNDVETFYISGGEPLLHPDLLRLIKHIKNKNMTPVIYSSGCIPSNGSSAIQEVPPTTLLKLERAGLDSLVFSIYSMRQNIHDAMTNTSHSLNSVLKTIENSLNTFSNTKIELSFIPLDDTWNEINDILDFSQKNNIYKLNILKLIHQGRARKSGIYSRNLSPENEYKFIEQLKKHKNSSTILEISKLYDCDHYEHLQTSPYSAGINEYFITSKQEVLPGRRYRN